MKKHINTGDFLLAGKAETQKYGVKGAAENPGTNDLFPPDWTCNLKPEHARLELGSIGLNQEKLGGVITATKTAGSFEGQLYFSFDPIISLLATTFGEECYQSGGKGGNYVHRLRVGENIYNDTSGSYGELGTKERHMTIAEYTGLAVFKFSGSKGTSVDFNFDHENGYKVSVSATAYGKPSQMISGSSPSGWTSRIDLTQTALRGDMVLASGPCSSKLYIREYAASGEIEASANEVRVDSLKFSYNTGNTDKYDTGSGDGIQEPKRTGGNTVEGEFVIPYGNDDDDYGVRDRTNEYLEGTNLQLFHRVTGPSNKEFIVRIVKMELKSEGIPMLDDMTGEEVGMTYSFRGIIPNETVTGSFQNLADCPLDIAFVNAVSGVYLQDAGT